MEKNLKEKIEFQAITNGIDMETWVLPEIMNTYYSQNVIDKFGLPTEEFKEQIDKIDAPAIRQKREPDKEDSINIDTYFDEDAYTNPEDTYNTEIQPEWSGTGELILPDFEKFVKFLSTMVIIPKGI